MRINVITIFPEIFDILNVGVISKSLKNKIIKLDVRDLRKNATNKHNNIDSKPYGGGEGMVMMAEPIAKTLKQIKKKERGPVIFMSPQGEKLDQKKVKSFSKLKNITIICGRYEGIDQRVIDRLVLDGKIFDTEYQMAQWYFELASSSIRMPNLVSNMNMEKVTGGGDYISNKQMNAMLRLRRVDKLIEEKFKDGIKLLRNTVIYDESIKEEEVPALKKILKYILDNQSKF